MPNDQGRAGTAGCVVGCVPTMVGHRGAAPLFGGKQRLTIDCDRTGLEVFASDGLCYVPMPFNVNPENRTVSVETRGGLAAFSTLDVHELRSAWEKDLKAVS